MRKYLYHILITLTGYIIYLLLPYEVSAQQLNQVDRLQQFANQKRLEWQRNKTAAESLALQLQLPLREEYPDGTVIEVIKIAHGIPLYYITHNANAAITTRTNHMWPGARLGLNLTGSGYDKLGEWDGGGVLTTHNELNGRVTQMDGNASPIDHSTHVAGTLIASGIVSNAKGMAYQANLKAYEWNYDLDEMAAAASNGMEISNHSYGFITGWYWDSYNEVWFWWGDTDIAQNEDYKFGYYDFESRDWDQVAYDYPNYLIVKSAGNDRGDYYSGTHLHPDGQPYNDSHEADGGSDGFDCISSMSGAKNILTVGAVYDVLEYSGPSSVTMSSFSGWGPTDDGRIKPDIVANGIALYSSFAGGNNQYGTYSGTSMASPNAAGTLALLQQHYQNLHGAATPMRSATLKALVLHTADECGANPGPDYAFGWGLINAERAARFISRDLYQTVLIEEELLNGASFQQMITVGGEYPAPLKVTIAWTDPPGAVLYPPELNDPDPKLVHDLDLSISHDGTMYYPWTLDPSNPAAAAARNDRNFRDNVEQVYIDDPVEGDYTITVNHSGTLTAAQEFSLIIEGDVPISTFPFSENFDDFTEIEINNDWQNGTNDDFEWIDYTGGTPTAGTGPDADHTSGSGQYLYAEASAPNYPNKSANLLTPLFDLSALNNPALQFWYHMYDDQGSAMGDLHVDIYSNGSWHNSAVSFSGNQGNQWHPASIDLSPYKNSAACQIRFRAITGQSEKSDIAIDDFMIYPEAYYTFPGGSTAPHEFANTDVTIEFTAPNSSDISLSVIKNNSDPGIVPPLPDGVEHVSPERYWSVDALAGTVDGIYIMTIDLAVMGGISDYSTLLLLKRDNSSSSWLVQGTNAYGGSGTVVSWTDISGGFSDFAIGGGADNSLPVTLMQFTAAMQKGNVLLKWHTESEIENVGFIIQRRKKGSEDWNEIASYLTHEQLLGQGNSSNRSEYQFLDATVQSGLSYQYRLGDVGYDGMLTLHDMIEIDVIASDIPQDYVLNNAYPNPFNTSTVISWQVGATCKAPVQVDLSIYNIRGQKVSTLVSEKQKAGSYQVEWNASDVASGIYLYRLSVKSNAHRFVATKKLIVLK